MTPEERSAKILKHADEMNGLHPHISSEGATAFAATIIAAIRDAVAEEREACAKMADNDDCESLARDIRARGEQS